MISKNLNFVSLGGACRPAAQIRKNIEGSSSYPFDWTITSYNALTKVFSTDFQPAKVLTNESINIKKGGAISCSYSGIDFVHGLNRKDTMKWLKPPMSHTTHTMPLEFYASKELKEIKQRFLHTYKKLNDLKEYNGSIVFIRWLGHGRNDAPHQKNFPHAGVPNGTHDDENFFKLFNLLQGKYPNVSIRLFEIFTHYSKGDLSNRVIEYYDFENMGGVYLLQENIPSSFSGDDESWKQLFSHINNH